jgi:hypothetical protein
LTLKYSTSLVNIGCIPHKRTRACWILIFLVFTSFSSEAATNLALSLKVWSEHHGHNARGWGLFDWEKYTVVPGFFFHSAGLFLLTLVTFSYFFLLVVSFDSYFLLGLGVRGVTFCYIFYWL